MRAVVEELQNNRSRLLSTVKPSENSGEDARAPNSTNKRAEGFDKWAMCANERTVTDFQKMMSDMGNNDVRFILK